MRRGAFSLLVLAITSWRSAVHATFLAPKPRWAAYSDQGVAGTTRPPTPSQIEGYNVFILSFLLTTGPADALRQFTQLDANTRSRIISDYHAKGISLMVAAFGDRESPTGAGKDPVKVANDIAAFVKKYQFDGVDIDYEDFDAMNAGTGVAEAWLASFTRALRMALPMGQYSISHAPVAPWFTTNTTIYPPGAYRAVHAEVGDLIDWYNIQFYNQEGLYTTCETLLIESGSQFIHSSVAEINQHAGVPLDKIVITKPASAGDAAGGHIPARELARCLKFAKDNGWDAGVTYWQYPRASSSLLRSVTRGNFNIGSKCQSKKTPNRRGEVL